MHFIRTGLAVICLACLGAPMRLVAQVPLAGQERLAARASLGAQELPGVQEPLKNLPSLSWPLTGRKLVIAHCMTNIIRFKGHKLEDSCDPDYYAPGNNITDVFGGLTQVNVLEDPVLKNASLDEAVEFEMRAAIRSGIDGFQFYYTLGNEGWDSIIVAYLRVATEKKIPFKFTFCISHPSGSTERAKIESFSRRINGIFAAVGRDNDHWLRTPDGRLIVYMWYGEQLADVPVGAGGSGAGGTTVGAEGVGAAVTTAGSEGSPQAFYVARAFQRLADAVHEKFACVYSINMAISQAALADYLDYFPAVWMWTLPWSDNYPGIAVAAACRERHRTFTGSAFADFYTSKLLKKGTWDMYHNAADAVAAGIGQVERKYITTGLSYNFRKLLEFGLQQDVPIINIITWNDYPEGHHLAPEVNHNDGFAQLLIYYKHLWKNERPLGEGGKEAPDRGPGADGGAAGGKEPGAVGRGGDGKGAGAAGDRQTAGGKEAAEGKELAIVFFKKYKHDVQPHPYNIPVVPFQQETIAAASEDSIEVVTLLNAPAQLVVDGRDFIVPAGLTATRIPSQKGTVRVGVFRNGGSVLQFSTPEGITDTPYRSDKLTYALSSGYASFYKDIFGDIPMVSSREYSIN